MGNTADIFDVEPSERGGRTCIVDENTLPVSLEYGFVATGGNLKSKRLKTTADLFSDALGTREGDFIIFWSTRGGNGFKGVFQVDSDPFFDPTEISVEDGKFKVGSNYPIRYKISPVEYYEEPVSEYEMMTSPRGITLWNPRYKKALGRGRSATSLTPWEVTTIKEKLKRKNNSNLSEINFKNYPGDESQPIHIDLSQSYSDQDTYSWEHVTKEGNNQRTREWIDYPSLSEVESEKIPFVKDSGRVFQEKVLEAWLMENIDKDLDVLEGVLGPAENFHWFGNYLPHSILGGNMDGVVFHDDGTTDPPSKISVIELKRGTIGTGALNEIQRYWKRFSRFLCEGVFKPHLQPCPSKIRPVLIGFDHGQDNQEEWEEKMDDHLDGSDEFDPYIITYRAEDGEMNLRLAHDPRT